MEKCIKILCASIGVNTNANAANEPVLIGENANAIKLTKDVDAPSQIRSKKRHLLFAFAYYMPHAA